MRWFERQRIDWIQLRLQTVGHLQRKDLTTQFGVSVPQASKDIATFKRLRKKLGAPKVVYNTTTKRYEAEWFQKAPPTTAAGEGRGPN